MANSDWNYDHPRRDSRRQPSPEPEYERGGYEREEHYRERPPPKQPRPKRTGALMSLRPGGMLVLIGVILFFVGTIIVQSSTLVEPPDSFDSDDMEDYYDLVRNLVGFGKIFTWIGAMVIVLPLYIIGITHEKLDWKIRASMLTTATTIVVATMITTMFFSLTPGIF